MAGSSSSKHPCLPACIIILCLCTLAVTSPLKFSRKINKKFSFSSYSFADRVDDINLLGSAKILTDGSIEIPSDDQLSAAGRALYSSPIRMWDPNTSLAATFNTTFSFLISHQAAAAPGSSKGSNGGGLTFIVAPDEVTVGREAGWLGMLNEPCTENQNAFAVEFDAFKDDEFGDPNDNHVGINLASVQSSFTADASDAGVFLRNGSYVTAWINYDGNDRHIEVRIANTSDTAKPVRPIISVPLDLSPLLKEYMFVGFTAASGGEALKHRILSWNFSSTAHAVARFPNKLLKDGCLWKAGLSGTSKTHRHRHESKAFLILLCVSVVVLLAFINRVFGRSNPSYSFMQLRGKIQRPRPLHKPRRFKYPELVAATKGFHEKEKLGQGGYGSVYKGILQDGSLVAVKRLSNLHIQGSEKHLMNEICLLLGQKQPYLVQLRGWCRQKKELFLVSDYMVNGSLDKWLYPRPWTPLPWVLRCKVIKDIAAAITYLHEELDQPVLHRQVKTSNILLDVNLNARLGDLEVGFLLEKGKARVLEYSGSMDHHAAYMAPEARSFCSKATEKMDVFSFGVTILEIVCGRKPMDTTLAPGHTVLVTWVWELHRQENLLAAADILITGKEFNSEQLMHLLKVGIMCTHSDPSCRPTINQVLGFVTGGKILPPFPSKPAEGLPIASNRDAIEPKTRPDNPETS